MKKIIVTVFCIAALAVLGGCKRNTDDNISKDMLSFDDGSSTVYSDSKEQSLSDKEVKIGEKEQQTASNATEHSSKKAASDSSKPGVFNEYNRNNADKSGNASDDSSNQSSAESSNSASENVLDTNPDNFGPKVK